MARTFLSRQRLAVKLLRSPDIMKNSEGWRQICEILEERKVFIPDLIKEIISRTKTKNIDRPLAVCVLGKLYNKKLIPLFRKVLEESFKQKDNDSVYQTIVALDNLNQLEGLIGNNESLCLIQRSKNMRLAKKYLEHIRRKP